MCNVCCKEFRGWCKSFTRTEVLLTILEAVLLVVVFGLLVFLILHFLACASDIESFHNVKTTTKKVTSRPKIQTQTTLKPTTIYKTPIPFAPVSECTWKPSEKTKAYTKYYEYNTTSYEIDGATSDGKDYSETSKEIGDKFVNDSESSNIKQENQPDIIYFGDTDVTMSTQSMDEYDMDFPPEESDGEEAEKLYQQFILALVKPNPPRDIIFGCILTIVTEYWTVTSASCIEAIEEVDSLDSFVMIEGYGQVRKGRTHVISDVQIHPMYEGVNKSYDLAALKSEDSLMRSSGYTVELPSLIDYFMTTIGERLTLLGYGPFRTIDTSPLGKRLHKVSVYTLPSTQCASESETWSLRHVWGGAAVQRGWCGAAPLCAGVLRVRRRACNYCAGAPLLRGPLLLGLMSDDHQCGVSCQPHFYVNIARVRDWLDFVTGTK